MSNWLRSTLTACILAGGSFALAIPVFAQDETNVVVYRCDDGKGFDLVYLEAGEPSVEATFGSKVIVLPQVRSGSDTQYSNGSVTLHTKGNEAFVEVGNNRLFNNCITESGGVSALW